VECCIFGLAASEVLKLSFYVTEKMAIDHRINKDKKMAGLDWLIGF
jgi:hypothetical protein